MRSWPKHWRADNGWISGNGVCFDSGGTKTVSTTNTQQTGPWAPQQQYLTDIFAKAQNLYNAGAPQYYPNSTVTPTAPATQQAWTDIANLANNGSPVLDAANANALNTINGAYLNPGNPYIDAVTQSILGQVQPAVANQFSGSGRYQSTANSPVVAQAISDALAPQLFGNYKNERGLQQQAMGMAPSLTQANYLAPTMLEQAGSQKELIQGSGCFVDGDFPSGDGRSKGFGVGREIAAGHARHFQERLGQLLESRTSDIEL